MREIDSMAVVQLCTARWNGQSAHEGVVGLEVKWDLPRRCSWAPKCKQFPNFSQMLGVMAGHYDFSMRSAGRKSVSESISSSI